MIRIGGILLLSFVFITSALPQRRCDVDTRLAELRATTEGQQILDAIMHVARGVMPRSEVTLPVVFHVVYRTDEENISDLQIQSQIDILNRDFGFISDNIGNVPGEFYPLGGDTGLRFCLASVDPDGNPTAGITRTQTTVRYIGTHRESNGRFSVHYDSYGGVDGWDPNRYINVWVAEADGILGNAYLPGTAQYPEEDGIVMDPHFVGAVGLAALSFPFHRGHSLTHELGHYFGLLHIWGLGNGGCQEDDGIDDTPLQERPYIGCPAYPQYSCGSSDMFMNYMDYTDDRCLALFTRGQIDQMQAILVNFRPLLMENQTSCGIPDTGKASVSDALIFYAPVSRQIVIDLQRTDNTDRTVELFAADGRLVVSGKWQYGNIYWIDTKGIPPGLFVVRLEENGEHTAQKVIVFQ